MAETELFPYTPHRFIHNVFEDALFQRFTVKRFISLCTRC